MATSPVPESRTYVHDKCQGMTVVRDNSFEEMSNPLSDVPRTWCTTCNGFGHVSEYAWADTGEKITDYRARHSAKATSVERFLCSRTVFFGTLAVGLVGGLVGGYFLFAKSELWLKVLMIPFTGVVCLIFIGAILMELVTKTITWRICGVRDTRWLT